MSSNLWPCYFSLSLSSCCPQALPSVRHDSVSGIGELLFSVSAVHRHLLCEPLKSEVCTLRDNSHDNVLGGDVGPEKGREG